MLLYWKQKERRWVHAQLKGTQTHSSLIQFTAIVICTNFSSEQAVVPGLFKNSFNPKSDCNIMNIPTVELQLKKLQIMWRNLTFWLFSCEDIKEVSFLLSFVAQKMNDLIHLNYQISVKTFSVGKFTED